MITTQAARASLAVDGSVNRKAYKSFSVLRHYEQCHRNADLGQEPLLMNCEDRGRSFVVVTLDH